MCSFIRLHQETIAEELAIRPLAGRRRESLAALA